MKRILAIGVFAFGLAGAHAWAQGNETFQGTVKAISGSSVTVERGSITGVFAVESATSVGVKGATAKTKAAKAAGKSGTTVSDLVHVGDQVQIRYQEKSGGMVASRIDVRTSLAN